MRQIAVAACVVGCLSLSCHSSGGGHTKTGDEEPKDGETRNMSDEETQHKSELSRCVRQVRRVLDGDVPVGRPLAAECPERRLTEAFELGEPRRNLMLGEAHQQVTRYRVSRGSESRPVHLYVREGRLVKIERQFPDLALEEVRERLGAPEEKRSWYPYVEEYSEIEDGLWIYASNGIVLYVGADGSGVRWWEWFRGMSVDEWTETLKGSHQTREFRHDQGRLE